MSDHRRSARFDGRTVFLPNVDRLRPGDILLTFNGEGEGAKSAKLPRAIRRVTGGTFSHAMVCSEPPALVEATLAGVGIVSLSRCFAFQIENVRVLRHPDSAIAGRAAKLAQLEVGRDYSITRVAQAATRGRTLAGDRGTFCSALVAQVFTAAGATEFARTPIEKTTPATIEGLDTLQDVTANIFREAPAPRNAETMTALDGDPAPTPSSCQTEISSRYAKALLPEADRLVAAHPTAALRVTPTYWGMLDLVLRAHDAAASLRPAEAMQLVAATDAIDRKLADLIGSSELRVLLEEFQAIEGEEISRAVAQSETASPDIDRASLASVVETTRKQLGVRRAALDQMTEWNAGRSRAVEAYCELEAMTVASLEARQNAFRQILARIGG